MRTIGEDLRAVAAAEPDRTAVVTAESRISYGRLDELADAVAAGLRRLGVSRGDRVALVLPNSEQLAIAIYGVQRAGAAYSPLNPTIKRDKLAYVLANAEAAAVICDEDRAETARAAARLAGGPPVVTDVLELSPAGGGPPSPPLDLDLSAVIYTSGSTGDPKGVTLTHRNVTFAADSIIEYLAMDERDRVLCVLPLSFDYGLYQLLMSVRVGATLVLERGFAFPGRVVQLLHEERITGLPGVPTVFEVLSTLRGLPERRLPDLRFLTNTGAALPVGLIDAIRRTFPGVALHSMYGLTECKRVSHLPPEQVPFRPASVGVPIPGTDAWVDDGRGGRAAPGEVGELMVRGSHVMQGYWGDDEATAERLRPGRWPWERVLATGDLFRSDDEGYLYFVGRRDELIKTRGEKVMPREVEDVLLAMPGVRQAAVVGVPDRLLGHAVHAHVSPVSGEELAAAAVRGHCAARLEDHLVPQTVVVHDELPLTSNGKIDKLALASEGERGYSGRVTADADGGRKRHPRLVLRRG
jgi:amino acid adenylation domain-containing protein